MFTLDTTGSLAIAATLGAEMGRNRGLGNENETDLIVPMVFDWQSGGDARGLALRHTAELQREQVPAVAFTAKDYGADAGDLAPTLRAGGHTASHANAGVMPAVAFQSSQSGVREVEAHATLDSHNGSQRHNGVQSMSVRRLTPRECERLQAFPDDWTRVPWRDRPAEQCPDGLRYKTLGNAVTVSVAEWIAQRLVAVACENEREARCE